MKIEIENLKKTLDISLATSLNLEGSQDPNFRRIHHHNHHIVLYVKDYVMKEKCKNYFEIGTHFGHSLCNVLQSKYASKFISCDLFLKGGTIAGDCKVNNVQALAQRNAKKFNINENEFKIIKGNSHSSEMLEKVKSEFPDGIDLFFIDGDHRRNAVISDFEMYFPLVNSGGFIIFDDYLPYKWNGKRRECPYAINDLVKKYEKELQVVGLIDDVAGCNKIKGLDTTKNSDFIVVKK